MKIIGIAGSNSSRSINSDLVEYVLGKISRNGAKLLDLRKFDIPMYGVDHEQEHGIPDDIVTIRDSIKESDAIVISVAEHNGNLTAFFKNILDWLSRLDGKYMDGKKILLLSASPGPGGGASALNMAQKVLPYSGAEIVASFGVDSFFEIGKYDPEFSIIDSDVEKELEAAINKLKKANYKLVV